MVKVKSNIKIENARIGFRNFSGKEKPFNPKGVRNFAVFFDGESAETLAKDGWNIKPLKPREEDDPPRFFLPVFVSFTNEMFIPKITLIKGGMKSFIGEDEVNILDWAEIQKVNIVIRPYNWEVGDKAGTKAFLKTMLIYIAEDEFEAEYRDIPDSESHEAKPPWED